MELGLRRRRDHGRRVRRAAELDAGCNEQHTTPVPRSIGNPATPAGERADVASPRGDTFGDVSDQLGVLAWQHGPIVMNTSAEIRQALAELRSGTFIRPE